MFDLKAARLILVSNRFVKVSHYQEITQLHEISPLVRLNMAETTGR